MTLPDLLLIACSALVGLLLVIGIELVALELAERRCGPDPRTAALGVWS